ncbi:MAG: 3-phosphoglycerate dehydrogenase, partial [Rubrivivax sp.]|nr:3-phosphoglycerate dehydrogenase [Rubrivivax sp.]
MADANKLRVLVLNQISPLGLQRLPTALYEVGKDVAAPDAVLLRSADLHQAAIAPSVKAIA